MMYMLDTDTCSYVLREKPRSVGERFRAHESDVIAISAIVHAELLYGAAIHPAGGAALERLIADFVSRVEIVPWSASRAHAELRATLKAAGTPIGNMDLLIAAHALEADAVLVTNNVRHFGRVAGLSIENWTER